MVVCQVYEDGKFLGQRSPTKSRAWAGALRRLECDVAQPQRPTVDNVSAPHARASHMTTQPISGNSGSWPTRAAETTGRGGTKHGRTRLSAGERVLYEWSREIFQPPPPGASDEFHTPHAAPPQYASPRAACSAVRPDDEIPDGLNKQSGCDVRRAIRLLESAPSHGLLVAAETLWSTSVSRGTSGVRREREQDVVHIATAADMNRLQQQLARDNHSTVGQILKWFCRMRVYHRDLALASVRDGSRAQGFACPPGFVMDNLTGVGIALGLRESRPESACESFYRTALAECRAAIADHLAPPSVLVRRARQWLNELCPRFAERTTRWVMLPDALQEHWTTILDRPRADGAAPPDDVEAALNLYCSFVQQVGVGTVARLQEALRTEPRRKRAA